MISANHEHKAMTIENQGSVFFNEMEWDYINTEFKIGNMFAAMQYVMNTWQRIKRRKLNG